MPTFVNDEVTLTDSHAILIYLCEKYSNGDKQLWPSDRIERIMVLNRLFYSGTLLFRRDSDLIVSSFEITKSFFFFVFVCLLSFHLKSNDVSFQGGIYVNQWKKDEIETHLAKICEQYDNLEKFLTENQFIASDHVCMLFMDNG